MACHRAAIIRRSQEPCGTVAFGSNHLQLNAADFADIALLVDSARAGDGLAATFTLGSQLVDKAQRVHHAGGRPADAIHMHRHLGMGERCGINAQLIGVCFGIRQSHFAGRGLGTGHVLVDRLLIFVGRLPHWHRRFPWHDLHLRVRPCPHGLCIDNRVAGHAGSVDRGQQQ